MSEKDINLSDSNPPELTPEQESEIDDLVDNKGFNYTQARLKVLGSTALEIPIRSTQDESDAPTSSKGRNDNPYPKGHPKKISSRLRGIGEEGEGKAEVLYGPIKPHEK